ncbi:MAG: sugar ABC transporter permease YjfF [Clostridiaceae bacterium]|nr:sugar ABC transporter permease YjfF [Clostridiaceae bacterium]
MSKPGLAKIEGPGAFKRIKEKLLGTNFLLFVTILLFALMYISGTIIFKEKNFGNTQFFLNLIIGNAGLIITAVGMTMVLIIGGIDISVGSVIAVTCMMLAALMEKANIGAVPAILIVLLFGLVFGAVQGWLIAYLRLQPFIVTLAGMFFARGLTAVISLKMITITNKTFLYIARYKIYLPFGGTLNRKGVMIYPYIYPTVILAMLVLVAAFVMLKYTKFGRSIYAVGGSEHSAMLMGLNPRRTQFTVYIINGFLAALGGIAFCLNTTGAFVELGKGFEMEAIASTVIGGTPLTGGVGNVFGTLFGVLIKATIEALVNFQGNVSSWWSKIIIAALLALFIVLQSLLSMRKESKR